MRNVSLVIKRSKNKLTMTKDKECKKCLGVGWYPIGIEQSGELSEIIGAFKLALALVK